MSRQASADLQRSKSIVRRFDELIRDGDPSDLATVCTLDMVNHALDPSRPQGLEGTREFLIECRRDPRRAEWMRGLVHRDWGVVAEGDLVVQFVEVEASGRAGCSAASTPRAGRTRRTPRSCTGLLTAASRSGGPSGTSSA
jgi:hypothetical protein